MADLIDRQAAFDAILSEVDDNERPIVELRWWNMGLTRASEILKLLQSAQPEITLEQVKEYCKENGYVVLLSDEYNWLKSLKSKAEEYRWNGGGNY